MSAHTHYALVMNLLTGMLKVNTEFHHTFSVFVLLFSLGGEVMQRHCRKLEWNGGNDVSVLQVRLVTAKVVDGFVNG